jgi:hypothetical protein
MHVTDTGDRYVCDGTSWQLQPPLPPVAPKAGDTRFNAQADLFEYFDGNAGTWVAVAKAATP